VGLVVATAARMDGTKALMSSDQLAARTGLSNATVRRRLAELQDLGWLTLTHRGGYRGPNKAPDANVFALSQPLTEVSGSVVGSTAHEDEPDSGQPLTQVSSPSSSTKNPRGASMARAAAKCPHNRINGSVRAGDGTSVGGCLKCETDWTEAA
jgi:biotin operon repressor